MSVTSKNILNSNSSTFAIAGTEGDVTEFIQSAVGRVVSQYSATSTYEVGEILRHEGYVYKCTTAITSPESWTQAHWTAATDADIAARLKMLKSDGFATDAFAANILEKQVAKEPDKFVSTSDRTNWNGKANSSDLPIPISVKNAGFTTESYKRFVVTVGGDMTVTLHTPTAKQGGGYDADVFECRFDGASLAADASIAFEGATATTMDTDCGTVKAGKVALMSAFWNGTTWDVNWKVEG